MMQEQGPNRKRFRWLSPRWKCDCRLLEEKDQGWSEEGGSALNSEVTGHTYRQGPGSRPACHRAYGDRDGVPPPCRPRIDTLFRLESSGRSPGPCRPRTRCAVRAARCPGGGGAGGVAGPEHQAGRRDAAPRTPRRAVWVQGHGRPRGRPCPGPRHAAHRGLCGLSQVPRSCEVDGPCVWRAGPLPRQPGAEYVAAAAPRVIMSLGATL